jgi:hypothetical protein
MAGNRGAWIANLHNAGSFPIEDERAKVERS